MGLSSSCNQTEAERIKEKISEFLQTHRKDATWLREDWNNSLYKGYKSLGFEIRLNVSKPKQMKVLLKHKNGTYSRPLRRTTSCLITIEPDSERILKRLK